MGYGYFPYIQGGTSPNIFNADGTLLLQISAVAAGTNLKGNTTSGKNLTLYANSANSYPRIDLDGNSKITLIYTAASKVGFLSSGTPTHDFTYASNVSNILGGGITGDDIILKANTIDTYPFIELLGDGWVNIQGGVGSGLALYEAGAAYGGFEENTDFVIESYVDRNIFLSPHGTGKVKFGTYSAGVASDSTGYILIKDAGGTDRKLMVQA